MAETLTERQAELHRWICRFIREKKIPPSIREIRAFLGISSTNGVNDHLVALEKKGYIQRSANKARSIVVLVDDAAREVERQDVRQIESNAVGAAIRAVRREVNMNLGHQQISRAWLNELLDRVEMGAWRQQG